MSDSSIHKAPIPKTLLGLLILFTLIILLPGLQIISKQKQSLLRNKQAELSAITELKADQVSSWRKQILADAQVVQDNDLLIDFVHGYLPEEGNIYQRESLTKWMKSLLSHYDYKSIVLLNSNWKAVIAFPESESQEGATIRYGKEKLVREHKVVLTDLHKVPDLDYAHFDVLIPLYKSSGNDSIFVGLFLIRVDPNILLYPLLERWPTKSATGEICLLRNDGDSITYISGLRFSKDAVLKLRSSITDINPAPAVDNKNINDIIKIRDYRNEPVLEAHKAIAETNWIVLAKIDIKEVLSTSQKAITPTKIILALIVLLFLSLGSFLIWIQLVQYYKKMYRIETDKQALIKHFDYILKYANDLIFLVDDKLKIIEANDKVFETYGYPQKDLIGMKASDLRAQSEVSALNEQYVELRRKKSLTFNTIHKKKNGDEFPVEISARVVEIEGNVYYQTICRDITERKRNEQYTKNILQKYNLALSAADMGVWEWDFINNKLTWDDTVSRIYGKDKDKITDSINEWIDVVHPDDIENARAEIRRAVAGQSDYNSEYRVILPDGTIKDIRSTGRMLRDSQNNPNRMTGVTLDITEQKRAYNLLRERDFWLTESQRVGQVGSFSMDFKANTWSTSEVLDDILGLKKGTPKTIDTWKSLIHPDYSQEINNYFIEEAKNKKKNFTKEYKIIKQDTGVVRWIIGRGEFNWGDGELPVSLIGIFQDITDRKNAEEELRQSNKKINTIINNFRGVIFSCRNDKDWTMKYISDGIYELSGYRPEDFIDNKRTSFNNLIYNPDRARVWKEIQESLKEESSYTIEFRIRTSTGDIKWVWEHGRASFDEHDMYIEGFITDITDRKHVEEELIRAKEKAEESDRLKTAFLHNISHEIRTPMNAIVGFTTLLDVPDINEETRHQYMDIIFQSSNQLLSIITDIVDISNIEVGHIKLSAGAVNINTLIKNLYDQFSIRANQQGIKLFFRNTLSDDASFIKTDSTKLMQVLANLINNALKFTPSGSIEFGYNLRDNDVEFFIKDTGIGIDEDNFEKIFNRFYQIDNALSKQFSGTGLGLAISKAYVELMNGRIWLTSKPGKGTTFFFTIPYDNPERQIVASVENNEKKMSKVKGKTILVAEDDRINFLLIREILSKTGVSIIWASNGEEAVEVCRNNQDIDIILMDIKMPLLDGYEAQKIIKTFRPSIPVVALTAYAQESDREKSLAEGCVDHINKPIDRTQLFAVLQKYL